jgi:hypothetical protein
MIVAVSITNRDVVAANNVSFAVSSTEKPQPYEFVEYNSALVPGGTLERTQIILSPGDKIVVRWGVQYPGNSITSDDGKAMLVSSSTPGDNNENDLLQLESRGVAPTQSFVQGVFDRSTWAYGTKSGYRFDASTISSLTVEDQVATVEFLDINYGTSTPLQISESVEIGTIVGDTTDGTTLDTSQPFYPVTVSSFDADEGIPGNFNLVLNAASDGRLFDQAGGQWPVGSFVYGQRSAANGEITGISGSTLILQNVTDIFEENETLFTVEPGSIAGLSFAQGSPLWVNPEAGQGPGGGGGAGDGSGSGGNPQSGGDVGHTGSDGDYLDLTAKTNTAVFDFEEDSGNSVRVSEEYWYDTTDGTEIPFTPGTTYTIKFFWSGGSNSLEINRVYERTGQIQLTSATGFRGNLNGNAWNIGLDDTDGTDWYNTIQSANGGRWFEFYETAPLGGGGGGGGGGGNPATYAVTPAATSVNEGEALTVDVAVTGVPGGTTLYWSVTRQADFTESTGSFTVQSGVGQFTVTPLADATTEGAETFTVSIRTDSVSGTIVATSDPITINDVSLDSPAPVIGPDGSSLVDTTTGTTDPILDPKVNGTVNGQEIDGDTYTIPGWGVLTPNGAQENFTVGDSYVIEFFYNDGANSVQLTRTFEFVGLEEDGVTRHGVEEVTTNGFRCNKRGDTWTIGDGTNTGWITTLQNSTGTRWFEINPA